MHIGLVRADLGLLVCTFYLAHFSTHKRCRHPCPATAAGHGRAARGTTSSLSPCLGAIYPYVTTCTVWFPDGETVTIGNARMIALSYDVNGNREKPVVGQEREQSTMPA